MAPYVQIASDFAFPVVCDLPLELLNCCSCKRIGNLAGENAPGEREAPLAYTVMFCARLVKRGVGILVFLGSLS